MSLRVWVEGDVIDPSDAMISLTGDAMLRGLSVFEGLMAYRQPTNSAYAVVSLHPHLDRLKRSADLMKLPITNLPEDVVAGIRTLLAGEHALQLYVRPTVYLERGYYGGQAVAKLFVSARTVDPPEDRPLDCAIASVRHVPPTAYPHEAKVGALYAFYRLARLEAERAGADEAILLTTDGLVAETPGASIFIVKDEIAYTPPIDTGILPSITRRTAIDILSRCYGVLTVEAAFTPDALLTADEVFLAGTMDEIRPVGSVDGYQIRGGRAPITWRLRNAYLQACRCGQPDYPIGTEGFAGAL